MDFKDLMVGDWVYMGNPVTDELVPTKVANIYGEEINCKTGHTNDDVPTILSGKWLRYAQPIPLTEEILVKNGWDFRDRQWAIECKEDERGIVELSRDKGGYYWSINWDEYLIIRIHYVHELQHILRLCGIEKELVID